MNLKIKPIFIAVLLMLTVLLVAGCSRVQTPYQINDAQRYTVSVKYDANGGDFTNTNTLAIVDSYDATTNGGKIALLAPDDAQRGKNAFRVARPGYFLAGWYTQRTDAGTYAGKWDFEKDVLTIDPGKEYTSAEPVLTLYAAWVPLFEIEYYDLATGELLQTAAYNPTQQEGIALPQWDTETGTIRMNDVPQRQGYTMGGIYLDAEGTQPVRSGLLTHPGTVDAETAAAENTTLRLYTEWREGEWYQIYTAEQFIKNANVGGSYEICADLDFADKIWPTAMMYGSFTGTIRGNGHTFRNITLSQTNNSKVNAGLFGQLAAGAQITDLTLENVTFTIKSGTRVAGTAYGLLAGAVSADAALTGISIQNSVLQIDSGCYFGTDDYVIGLVCGSGAAPVDASGIRCEAVGDAPETVSITVTEGSVTVEFITA